MSVHQRPPFSHYHTIPTSIHHLCLVTCVYIVGPYVSMEMVLAEFVKKAKSGATLRKLDNQSLVARNPE